MNIVARHPGAIVFVAVALGCSALVNVGQAASKYEKIAVPAGYTNPSPWSLSSDGRIALFSAQPLPGGGNSGPVQLFAFDRGTRKVETVTANRAGRPAVMGFYNLDAPTMSADGRYVLFVSDSNDLINGDTNGEKDVFLRDRKTRTTRRINVVNGKQLKAAFGGCGLHSAISADGKKALFAGCYSELGHLTADYAVPDLYMADLQSGKVKLAGTDAVGRPLHPDGFPLAHPGLAISADGATVAFNSDYAYSGEDTDGSPGGVGEEPTSCAVEQQGQAQLCPSPRDVYVLLTRSNRVVLASNIARTEEKVPTVANEPVGDWELVSMSADGNSVVFHDGPTRADTADEFYVRRLASSTPARVLNGGDGTSGVSNTTVALSRDGTVAIHKGSSTADGLGVRLYRTTLPNGPSNAVTPVLTSACNVSVVQNGSRHGCPAPYDVPLWAGGVGSANYFLLRTSADVGQGPSDDDPALYIGTV
jgi:hypothetical protein